MQDAIEHQDHWDIMMDKTKLVYVEWTASNYLEQEVSEMRILNRPTTSSLKFCQVPTRNTWDGKVFSEDDLLRIIQADKLWKNAEIFGKPRFIKPKHMDMLPPVATVLIDIKDTKQGEDAKALIDVSHGSTMMLFLNASHVTIGDTPNLYAEPHSLHARDVVTTIRLILTFFTVETASMVVIVIR
ncbi:hypothetical protein AX15_007551 [Amanita polypyramis BW_CC]|nr:hypothetical protein AX15_007551 [Amanita polypyramis BW_CC]